MASSLGVVWSEVAVYQTGCGPLYMPDWLERGCYLGVLAISGSSVFGRIVFRESLASLLVQDEHSTSKKDARRRAIALEIAEWLAFLTVAGAVLVLGNQMINGETMDGLSGIDLEKCRARQGFSYEFY
jgi:hypothetical protein